MAKNITLFGFVADVSKKIAKQVETEDGVATPVVATTDDVKKMIQDAVTPAFLQSLSSEKKEPSLVDDSDGVTIFMANGTPITIKDRADGKSGATITWDGGSMDVPENAHVFGGCHDDDTPVNGDITMIGGTIKNLFGGGLHKSHTVLAEVKVKGGVSTGTICGGGASSFTKDCKCENATWFDGDGKESPCQTDETRITMTGGKTGILYGGGEGIGCTKKVSMTVNNPEGVYDYVSAGGSNGYTGEVSMYLEDFKKIGVVQGVNRGHVDNIIINIDGGKDIGNVYAGYEVPDPNSTASFDRSVVNVKKSAIPAGLYCPNVVPGGNNGKDLSECEDEAELKKVSINYI